ncbi:hypothetical protein JX265_003115 [Neoarthrinium moseri]|uniref:Peptidase A1 domain-containing protein n=1 Tax=Neoarthrinium moseri TaxID=1658444 RepID=A0A9Q0ASJ7_9PEZI|nr:hypothetical protein JX265_003115 [Neoarthrinium moseri]
MALNTILLSLILSASQPASAQDDRAVDPDNHFLYPPLPGAQHTEDPTVFWNNINVTFGVAQTQPFKWVSDMPSCSPGSFNTIYWDGRIDPIDINNGSQAYLAAWNCSNLSASPVFFSHYFNLTGQAPSTSTSVLRQQ